MAVHPPGGRQRHPPRVHQPGTPGGPPPPPSHTTPGDQGRSGDPRGARPAHARRFIGVRLRSGDRGGTRRAHAVRGVVAVQRQRARRDSVGTLDRATGPGRSLVPHDSGLRPRDCAVAQRLGVRNRDGRLGVRVLHGHPGGLHAARRPIELPRGTRRRRPGRHGVRSGLRPAPRRGAVRSRVDRDARDHRGGDHRVRCRAPALRRPATFRRRASVGYVGGDAPVQSTRQSTRRSTRSDPVADTSWNRPDSIAGRKICS